MAVTAIITQARAPFTRLAYALKWSPWRCPIRVMISIQQEGLEQRLSPSTLEVYVAAIVVHYDEVDSTSMGKHKLIIRFLRGAMRLNPPRLWLVPSWDLSGPFWTTGSTLWAAGVSRALVSVSEDSVFDNTHLHQEGVSIFGQQNVPQTD